MSKTVESANNQLRIQKLSVFKNWTQFKIDFFKTCEKAKNVENITKQLKTDLRQKAENVNNQPKTSAEMSKQLNPINWTDRKNIQREKKPPKYVSLILHHHVDWQQMAPLIFSK